MRYYSNRPIKSWAVEDRPREKMILRGIDSLTSGELIGIILSSGTRQFSAIDIGRKLLEQYGDLDNLARASTRELMNIAGIGQAKAATLQAVFELARRRMQLLPKKIKIRNSLEIARYLRPKLMDLSHEVFFIILFNQNNEVISDKMISSGGTTSTIVDAKMVFKEALDQRACSLILAHNHPSGNPKPSKADEFLTKKLTEAGNLLDIRVLDHLIITQSGYYSFSDNGKMDSYYTDPGNEEES